MTTHDGLAAPGGAPATDADSASSEWVQALTGSGRAYEDGVRRLHELLLKGARREAGKRAGTHGLQGQELDDLAAQAAGDACMSVIRRIGDFRGDSRFTTWAYKFVILEVASKVGRHAWRRQGVSYDSDDWEQLPARLGAAGGSPQEHAEGRDLLDAIRDAVEHHLTPHQRRIFTALVLNGASMDEICADLGTNRNAVYKTLFDARTKIRRHLRARGLVEPGEAA